jgi:hypothetical protein
MHMSACATVQEKKENAEQDFDAFYRAVRWVGFSRAAEWVHEEQKESFSAEWKKSSGQLTLKEIEILEKKWSEDRKSCDVYGKAMWIYERTQQVMYRDFHDRWLQDEQVWRVKTMITPTFVLEDGVGNTNN